GQVIADAVRFVYVGEDTAPPTLVRATATQISVDVEFSEALDPATAQTAGNYTIDQGIAVSTATLQTDKKTVRLATSAHTPGQTYTLTVSNVKDEAGNTIVPGSQVQYTFTAVTDLIVDNSDPGFSIVSGTWTLYSQPANYYGPNLRFKLAGSGSARVRWQATLGLSGRWEVFAWWCENSNRGSNVPYIISNVGGPTTVRVNQQLPGGKWVSLGLFEFVPGPGVVEMTDDANGQVIADAVRFVYVGEDTAPPTLVRATATQISVDVEFSEALDPATAQTAANYTIDQGITVSTATLQADKKTVRLATSAHTPGLTYTVTVSNVKDEAGNTILPGSQVQYTFTAVTDLIVDNSDPGFSIVSGSWTLYSEPANYYGPNLRFKVAGSGTARTRWQATLGLSGRWEVFAWWCENANRGSNVPYIIGNVGGPTTVRVNQQLPGGKWVSLGVFDFVPGPGVIEMTDDANGQVIADAVRFVYVGGAAAPAAAPAGEEPLVILVDPDRGAAPLDVVAAALGVGPGAECAWDFGDGSSGKGLVAAHTYLSPGTYKVVLRAGGKTAQATVTVTDSGKK
ncbi:MAG: PKD domain-containing protein, partial [Planctomycetes bacterium]|nr:PKD domain-containing protein [Planctomycetota bacterium]